MLEWLLGWIIGVATILFAGKLERFLTNLMIAVFFVVLVAFFVVDPFKQNSIAVPIFLALELITGALGVVIGYKMRLVWAVIVGTTIAILMIVIPFAFIAYMGFPAGLVIGSLINLRRHRGRHARPSGTGN